MTDKDYFYDEAIGTEAQKLGRKIYRTALSHRRGFRSDQIGIPIDDDVWLEIFDELGATALEERKP